nr:hypothetical protein [uncultured Brevundimonas sp.]
MTTIRSKSAAPGISAGRLISFLSDLAAGHGAVRWGLSVRHVQVHTANELDSCGQNEWAPRATLGMFLAVVNGRQSYSTKLSRPFAGSNRSQKKSWR